MFLVMESGRKGEAVGKLGSQLDHILSLEEKPLHSALSTRVALGSVS
jgi:hypothetical protein